MFEGPNKHQMGLGRFPGCGDVRTAVRVEEAGVAQLAIHGAGFVFIPERQPEEGIQEVAGVTEEFGVAGDLIKLAGGGNAPGVAEEFGDGEFGWVRVMPVIDIVLNPELHVFHEGFDGSLGFVLKVRFAAEPKGMKHEMRVTPGLPGLANLSELPQVVLDGGFFGIRIEPLREDAGGVGCQLAQAGSGHQEPSCNGRVEMGGRVRARRAQGFLVKEEILPGHFQAADMRRLARAMPNEAGTGIVKARQGIGFLKGDLQGLSVSVKPGEQEPGSEVIVNGGEIPATAHVVGVVGDVSRVDEHGFLRRHEGEGLIVPFGGKLRHELGAGHEIVDGLLGELLPARCFACELVGGGDRGSGVEVRECGYHGVQGL